MFLRIVTIVVFVAVSAIVCLGPIPGASAYDQPALNLGFTSFLDGGPPAGPGVYLTQYFQFYTSGRFKDADGNRLLPSAAGESLKAYIFLSQFIYQSDQPVLFGGKWGLDFILPFVATDLSYSIQGPFPADNRAGVGDLLIGPFIQWDPVMGSNGPIFMHRIEAQVIFPTGQYDNTKEINPGSNYLSFDPYWAATYFITPRWNFDTRIHWLWNGENNDPNRAFAGAEDTQAGQAVHLNFSSAYEVLEKRLRLGVNGYYLKQITDSQVNGRDLPGREQVLGLGPGLVYHWSPNTHFFVNVYFETAVENRAEGQRYNFRLVHHF